MTVANRPTPPAAPRVPLLARPAVRLFAPFATSALFHVAVIGTGVALFKTAQVVFAPPTREQVIIPDTNLVENADNGGVPNPGLSDDPTRSGTQTADETVHSSDDWATRKTETLAQNLLRGSADVNQQAATPIGTGAAVGGGQVSGLNTAGLGEAASGNLAPFGPVDGGGAGQGKGLFGIPGGNVTRVAYLCDSSGSLTGSRALVLIKRELAESIGRLRPSQAFSVIFFRGGESRESTDIKNRDEILADGDSLMLATAKHKAQAYEMIERVAPRGMTDPRPALGIAFTKMKPQMIFLLVDGVDSSVFTPAQLRATVEKLNPDKKVRLTVIVVGDANEASLAPWRQLAAANGGELRRVTAQSR